MTTAAIPLCHPRRAESSFRPLKALHHFRKLIADKEDTEQVFHIIEALRDGRFVRSAERFFAGPVGQRALATDEHLPNLLDDHDRLRKLPANSVGQAYVRFMQKEGLTAQGLVDEFEKFRKDQPHYNDLLERYSNRLRDTHDLFHVLTGYGRDALGEQCVLAFSYSLNPNWGILFIAWAGARVLKKQVRTDAPVYAAVREAQRIGRAAANIAQEDIEALLSEPLIEARKRLNIAEPVTYQRAHAIMRNQGINPYDLLGQQKATA
jgi:ubiquinone biosynthesis protein COQ4